MPDDTVFPGADANTPSRAQYFSWVNNTNEGSNEKQTLINLGFFRWLHDTYGMKLDIYAWDAGNLDGAADGYGSMSSPTFKKNYPDGWDKIARGAGAFDCRLGLWGGPDGFGETEADSTARIELMSGLCRDYGMMLFKFDGVCGTLRPEKQDAFVEMMTRCRKFSPDLILLNHRLELGKGLPHATTWLWEGLETYIDVFMANSMTAPHNRAQAISRGLPPQLARLTEDHGVCLSSCMDFWEDDLILQAFNRCMILAPEIYGNPWLLRDDEYPKLARIYNLHRRYRDILSHGMVLPEHAYGPHAVSRGNSDTRILSLRNLTWQPVSYTVRLDGEIGLCPTGDVEVTQLHPTERVLGTFPAGHDVTVEVLPFRACLLRVACVSADAASAEAIHGIRIYGTDYEVVQDVPEQPLTIKLLGWPGTTQHVLLSQPQAFSKATLDGADVSGILNNAGTDVTFAGDRLEKSWHRKLADLTPVAVPADAETAVEAAYFAADNNALEVRSLARSGKTQIPEVAAARDAFFEQDLFWMRGVRDNYMWDNNPETFFSVWHRNRDLRILGGTLRLDCGACRTADTLILRAVVTDAGLANAVDELVGDYSPDRVLWRPIRLTRDRAEKPTPTTIADIRHNGGAMSKIPAQIITYRAEFPGGIPLRCVRIMNAPDRISQLSALHRGEPLPTANWRASNLFPSYAAAPVQAAWQKRIALGNEAPGSYLCVAMEGTHGAEKALAALRIGDAWIGAPLRAPSFPSVAWEAGLAQTDKNHTFYFPVTDAMRNHTLEVFAFVLNGGKNTVKPHVWITAYPLPLKSRTLVLHRK